MSVPAPTAPSTPDAPSAARPVRFYILLSAPEAEALEAYGAAQSRLPDQQASYIVRRWLRRVARSGDGR